LNDRLRLGARKARRGGETAWLVLCGVALTLALAACAQTPAQAPVAEAPGLRAQALIDSGNASFRAGDYTAAAKRFASAVVVSPEDPAAFYGLGMALAKLGRDDEARAAYARSRELSRGEIHDDDMPREVRYRRTVHP
jgi:Flp pilus assembly protein TadD